MPEPDDELTALRDADPLDPASVRPAHGAEGRALFERITMTVMPTAENAPPVTSATRRRPMLAAAAVVLLLVAAAVTLVVTSNGRKDAGTPDARSDDVVAGPISPGGSSTGSCVELYDLTTLANREVVFDGTVTAVDGDSVTFRVGRWYRGGNAPEVRLNGAEGLAGVTSTGAGAGAPLELGTRLLVAGDGGFAWSCGFTQPYDDGVAAQWDDVFSQ